MYKAQVFKNYDGKRWMSPMAILSDDVSGGGRRPNERTSDLCNQSELCRKEVG